MTIWLLLAIPAAYLLGYGMGCFAVGLGVAAERAKLGPALLAFSEANRKLVALLSSRAAEREPDVQAVDYSSGRKAH